MYVYEQTFEVEGKTHVRKGFLARVRLEPFGQGKIFPHEQTLSGPKADRLALYQATGFNLSPIFGLYPDPDGIVQRTVESGLRDRTPLVATDHLGVENKLWVVTDQETHTLVGGLMAAKSIFIADGHHRYETGLKYRDDLVESGQSIGPRRSVQLLHDDARWHERPGPADLTHSPARSPAFPGLTADELAAMLQPEFEVRANRLGRSRRRAAWEAIEAEGDQDVLGFGTVADGNWLLARLRSDATMDRLAPEHSPEWRSLGVSVLHVLVLKDAARPFGHCPSAATSICWTKSSTTWPRAAATWLASSPRRE